MKAALNYFEPSCALCGQLIVDRFLLRVSGRLWHIDCLRCAACRARLYEESSCFVRAGRIYCRIDYQNEFGVKCGHCGRIVSSRDWIRRARDKVYHLACFACDTCGRQLNTGEEFIMDKGKILCMLHYFVIDSCSSNDGDASLNTSANRASKRVRTTFTDAQLHVLHNSFFMDSNPDGQDLERIAQVTGLSKRVTQVWFQNMRARHKKNLLQKQRNLETAPTIRVSMTCEESNTLC